MQPEIDYIKIGQRIKAARLEKGYSQADLGALVGKRLIIQRLSF